jgi:dipeptidyl-peptidase-4
MIRAPLLFLALQPLVILGAGTADSKVPQVYRAHVTPHWFSNKTRFWYVNRLPGDGHEFIVVDTDRGTREPAFDQQRVAAELARILGREIPVNHLPIRSLDFDQGGESVVLVGEEKSWRLNLSTYALSAGPDIPDEPVDMNPRPSSRTGPSTEIVFVNSLNEELYIFWMAPDGSRIPYGSVNAGERRRQRTYDGHVWVVTKHNGSLVGVFEAAEGGTSARLSDAALRPGNGKPKVSTRGFQSASLVSDRPEHRNCLRQFPQ